MTPPVQLRRDIDVFGASPWSHIIAPGTPLTDPSHFINLQNVGNINKRSHERRSNDGSSETAPSNDK